jgi:Na+/alanine symporter
MQPRWGFDTMIKIYESIYCRIYLWQKRTRGEKEWPQISALVGLSIVMFLNIADIALFIEFLDFISFSKIINNAHILILMTVISLFNYYWFVHNRKYVKKCLKYENESRLKHYLINALLILYTLCSAFGALGIAYLISRKV